jgi:hypothetical protein
MTKFGMELKQYALKHKYENVKTVVKKINGKSPRVWFGIKYIEDL